LLDLYVEEGQLVGSTRANVTVNPIDGPPERPGPVIVPMPRRPGWERRKYPIRMTTLQRGSLLDHTGLSPGLTRKIKRAPDGTVAIDFRRIELDVLYDKLGESIAYARGPHKVRLMSLTRKIAAIFEQECDEAFGVITPEGR
jgi:hypothetical protein